jgi:hypothetical protein
MWLGTILGADACLDIHVEALAGARCASTHLASNPGSPFPDLEFREVGVFQDVDQFYFSKVHGGP